MDVRYVYYPTGADCADCGGQIGYRATFEMRDGRQHELDGRDGPACWNGQCANHGTTA